MSVCGGFVRVFVCGVVFVVCVCVGPVSLGLSLHLRTRRRRGCRSGENQYVGIELWVHVGLCTLARSASKCGLYMEGAYSLC